VLLVYSHFLRIFCQARMAGRKREAFGNKCINIELNKCHIWKWIGGKTKQRLLNWNLFTLRMKECVISVLFYGNSLTYFALLNYEISMIIVRIDWVYPKPFRKLFIFLFFYLFIWIRTPYILRFPSINSWR